MRHLIITLLCCLGITYAMAQEGYRYKQHGEYKDDVAPRWAIDAHIGGNSITHATTYHGQPHRHVLSAGLKIDFPFHFTEGDTRGLLKGLLNLY